MPEKAVVHDASFDAEAFQNKSRKKQGCDFFLPYFSKRSYEELLEFKNPESVEL